MESVRFGLAVSKDTPNILSRKKVDRFFCLTVFSYPVDYQNRTIFGDYPYQFNISLIERGSIHPQYVGDNIPAAGSSGYIRRLVRIKEPALAVINASSYDAITVGYNKTAHPDYLNGDNESVHEFSILINKSELLKDTIRDPTYQINPGLEQTIINITHLNQTIYPDRSICYTISLTNITIKNEVTGVTGLLEPPLPPYTATIDGDKEYNSSSSPLPQPSTIKENITLILEPPTYWAVVEKSYVNLKFKLENTSGRPLYCEEFNGTRFLNNTFTSPFGYNYSSANVIQPHLQDAVLQIKVSSGARTVTEIVVEQLEAAFKYDILSGLPSIKVQFIDQSKGSPVDWDWDFGDGSPHGTTSNPLHTYTTSGIKTVTLTVKDASGTSKSITKTVDLSPPAVTGIAPPSGPLAGGTTVTITGTALSSATAVSFGGTPGTIVTNTATQITVTSPAHAAGPIDITVTTPFGTSPIVAADQFTYVAPPAVTGVAPPSGADAGGSTVTITGTGFTGATAVSFGGTAATSFTVNSATQITATSPAHAAGTIDITVTTPFGTSPIVAADQFTYIIAPAVTGIAPPSGPLVGGTTVTITGSTLSGATVVSFGGTPGTILTNTATQITATSPAHAAGVVDIRVTTPFGTSAIVAADQFTYIAPPAVTGIAPSSGPLAGSPSVVITGTGFTGATAVSFGGTPAASFTVNSATQITATSPAHAAGVVDIRVTTPSGTSAIVAADQFSYVAAPTVTGRNPTTAPRGWPVSVTLTGHRFPARSNRKYDAIGRSYQCIQCRGGITDFDHLYF